MGKVVYKTDFTFAVGLACLLLPLKLVVAWLLAACIHELGHYLALRITGTAVYRISVGAMGARMDTEPMPPWKTVLCALAGPLSGLLLIFVLKRFSLLAICGVLQSFINLLPLFPMDGGRVLRCLLEKLPLKRPEVIYTAIESAIMGILLLLAVYLSLRLLLGPLPIMAVVFLFVRRKLSCKQHTQRVQ